MDFDGHACITAIPGHPREDVSKQTLHELIARDYPWQAERGGSYFGSPVQRRERVATPVVTGSTRMVPGDPRSGAARPDAARSEAQSNPGTSPYVESSAAATPSRKRTFTEFWRKTTKDSEAKQSPAGERSDSGADGIVHQAPSQIYSPSYYTTYDRTPRNSQLTTPVAGPAPRIQARAMLPAPRDPVLSSLPCKESDSTTSHLRSMFPASSGARSSHSELQPQVTEDLGGRYRDLTTLIHRKKDYPSRSGSSGDIWECNLITGKRPQRVAVKALRVQRTDPPQDLATQEKKLRRELKVWARLQHDNVVELLGVVSGFGVLPSMVCPWFSNGSLFSYLSNHEGMGLSVRQGILSDIASGLRYREFGPLRSLFQKLIIEHPVHSQDVVHGNLHIHNVLIDENGRARLTDFGLSVIIQDFPGTSYLKLSICDALRYADPELVRQVHADDRVVYPTKPSDIYSFGGVTLYVLSGKQPYEGMREILVCTTILRGDRPLLPVYDQRVTPQYKSLIQRCWNSESMRPSAEEIMTSLREMLVEQRSSRQRDVLAWQANSAAYAAPHAGVYSPSYTTH
ncbi:hypothetical protein PAXINDRAFT_103686 [Paxillus involutus ATCC 200175]|uniref:Protein kinase domain-containing protein n=1 Tax=Paxillus involutus ATCC 200175 TaxID=664439 RepID=A0A0C9SM70_PAXIN|nr:hypothetical protein PAXINDRAFT_103686 [Paxillus involutus ATCC 200175]